MCETGFGFVSGCVLKSRHVRDLVVGDREPAEPIGFVVVGPKRGIAAHKRGFCSRASSRSRVGFTACERFAADFIAG